MKKLAFIVASALVSAAGYFGFESSAANLSVDTNSDVQISQRHDQTLVLDKPANIAKVSASSQSHRSHSSHHSHSSHRSHYSSR